jgi:hypothetical protein
MGTEAFSLGGGGVMRPELEIDCLPSSRVEVKNDWNYATSSPVCLYGVDRENLTLLQ